MRVNVISPGVVNSETWSGIGEDERTAFFADIAGGLPVGRPGEVEDEAHVALAVLENLVVALRRAGAPLERVTFIQGGKVYGAQLGVYKSPAREDDSRHFPPNLYFRLEDFARSLEREGIH